MKVSTFSLYLIGVLLILSAILSPVAGLYVWHVAPAWVRPASPDFPNGNPIGLSFAVVMTSVVSAILGIMSFCKADSRY